MAKKRAIGYLRSDISGSRQEWDESQLRSLSARFGYDLCKTLAFGPATDRPMYRLRIAASRTQAEAVFVPSVQHFDNGEVPDELTCAVAVVAVDTEQTIPRMTARMRLPEPSQPKNPGREGGPLGFQHTANGVVPIADDGLPLIDDEHPKLDSAVDSAALDRYPVVDIEPERVTNTEIDPWARRGSQH